MINDILEISFILGNVKYVSQFTVLFIDHCRCNIVKDEKNAKNTYQQFYNSEKRR